MQTSLASSPAIDTYFAELRRWLHGTADNESALYRAGAELCVNARDLELLPEQILIALHEYGMPLADSKRRDDIEEDRRYIHAVELLMQAYFGDGR